MYPDILFHSFLQKDLTFCNALVVLLGCAYSTHSWSMYIPHGTLNMSWHSGAVYIRPFTMLQYSWRILLCVSCNWSLCVAQSILSVSALIVVDCFWLIVVDDGWLLIVDCYWLLYTMDMITSSKSTHTRLINLRNMRDIWHCHFTPRVGWDECNIFAPCVALPCITAQSSRKTNNSSKWLWYPGELHVVTRTSTYIHMIRWVFYIHMVATANVSYKESTCKHRIFK